MYTQEMINLAKKAESPEELITIAKENGIDMTAEEAAEKFALLHSETGEISDDELDNVAGGGCGGSSNKNVPASRYNVGDMVILEVGRTSSGGYYRVAGTVEKKTYKNGEWVYQINKSGEILKDVKESSLPG